MNAIALQSGSGGNCIYVESNGTALLFDAGISGIKAEERLAAVGRDIRNVSALVLSHDHADHARCAGIYQRKYGLPIYATSGTLAVAGPFFGAVNDVRPFDAGATLHFNGLSVETVPTAHDGADGVAFVVSAKRKRLGILTDLGHVFDGLNRVVKKLDGVFMESNYDPKMLEDGPYPRYLKERIRGPGGHISNEESADLLAGAASPRLKWACLAHLSQHNNTPAKALRTHRRTGGPYHLCVTRYTEAADFLEL